MKTFNFYNNLTVTLDAGGHKGYEKYFNNEYLRITGEAAEAAPKGKPVIDVRVVKSLPEARAGDVVREVRYKKLFNYRFLIRDLKSKKVTIFFQHHWVDKVYMNAIGVFLQAQVLEPIMYLKLLEENVLFMHGGGVMDEVKKCGYLLPAHGGTGKTTFSIALLNQGYKLLGDDLLFVDIDKKIVYPYPRPMHIFTYNVNNLNGATIPFKYKFAIYAKNFLRFFLEKFLHTEFLISTRIHADEVFPGNPFGSAVPYKKILFLRKQSDAIEKKALNKNTIGEVALEIMNSADLNDSLYEIIENKKEIEKIKKLEQATIENLLKQFDSLSYVNTRKLDLANLQPFIEKNF